LRHRGAGETTANLIFFGRSVCLQCAAGCETNKLSRLPMAQFMR
jgi:hypothetical protein